jgi:CheY-like chemotaxis protein
MKLRTALVVDDEPDLRELVAVVLVDVGFDVRTAESGIDALDILSASAAPPDLIVLDVQMPVLDGWDTLAAIRERDATKDVPVLVCTVRSHPSDAERAWRLGCDGFIRKPFAISELADAALAAAGRSLDDRLQHRRRQLEGDPGSGTAPDRMST